LGAEKKRKFCESFGELALLGTYGIVSTGWKWIFTRIQKQHNGRVRLSTISFWDKIIFTITRRSSRIWTLMLNKVTSWFWRCDGVFCRMESINPNFVSELQKRRFIKYPVSSNDTFTAPPVLMCWSGGFLRKTSLE
jgi:hypothetical protein